MRSLLNGVLITLAVVAPVMAEPRSFSVDDPSGQYLVEVLFPELPQDLQQLARALITVRDKTSLAILQQLQTPATSVPLDQNGKTVEWRLMGENGVVYFADINHDGHQTGIWRITRETVEPYRYSGTWVSSAKGNSPERHLQLHEQDRDPEYHTLGDVPRDQRSGHYQLLDDLLDRDGDLDLDILPDRDARGREVAEFTVTMKHTGTEKVIFTAHHSVPMETENLIIVSPP